MAQFVNMFEVDLDKRSYPVNLNQTVSEGNVSSNRIGAYVYKDGQPYNLGGNCTGLVMRADGSTVPLAGVIDGNAAYVVLDQPSCAIPGPIQVAVNWVSGSNTTTLLVAYGTVIQTDTRDYVQPGTPIPDINTLLAAIADMEDATAAANAAANNALGNFAGAFNATQAYTAGTYVTYTDGKLYVLTGDHAADVTWANTSKTVVTVGTELVTFKDVIIQDNIFDYFIGVITKTSGTHNGVTYTWNADGTCTVTGSSSSASVNALFANAPLPNGLTAGKTYHVVYETSNKNINLGFVWRTSASGTATYYNVTETGEVTIPDGTTHMAVRLIVSSGKTFETPATVSAIKMLNRNTNDEAIDDVAFLSKDQTKNSPAGFTYFTGITDYDSTNRLTPSLIPINSYFYTKGERISGLNTDDDSYYWVWCFANLSYTNVRLYVLHNAYKNTTFGYSTDAGATVNFANDKNTVKILSIGSSFGQDATVYAPFIMEEMNPHIDVIFGIVYMSGGSISQYNGWYDDDTLLNYYKRNAHKDEWENGTQKSLKTILTDEDWDIILVNQSAYDGGVESTYSDLPAYLWKIVSRVHHPVQIGYLMPQAAIAYTSRYTYSDLASCAQNVLNTSMVSFVIPSGTAIENARHTSLDSIGNYASISSDGKGHLCADGPNSTPNPMPGHLQEGLPVLISNYVTAAVLLEKLTGISLNIMGCQTSPTATWVTNHNIPGQNGTSTGLDATNVMIGQRCAVQAVKFPFEVTMP